MNTLTPKQIEKLTADNKADIETTKHILEALKIRIDSEASKRIGDTPQQPWFDKAVERIESEGLRKLETIDKVIAWLEVLQ
jgi:hypothetical protein